MDALTFLTSFQDHLAPRLDTYEQAIYLYIVRHSRLIDEDEVVIGFKSARTRKRIAMGSGQKGKAISENSCYRKIESLEKKGFVKILSHDHLGFRLRAVLPCEIPDLLPPEDKPDTLTLEEMDFFNVAENRTLILEREEHHCFYCLCPLNGENFVIEHVESPPSGKNGYRDVVGACRHCNNRKGPSPAEDLLRTLLREARLSETEFDERISHLERLREGELKPTITG